MTLEKTDIFIMLDPPKHEHGMSPFIKIFHPHFGDSFQHNDVRDPGGLGRPQLPQPGWEMQT